MNISERLTYDFYAGPEEGKFSLALTMETNGGEDIEVVRLYTNESFDFCMTILETGTTFRLMNSKMMDLLERLESRGTKNLKQT